MKSTNFEKDWSMLNNDTLGSNIFHVGTLWVCKGEFE